MLIIAPSYGRFSLAYSVTQLLRSERYGMGSNNRSSDSDSNWFIYWVEVVGTRLVKRIAPKLWK
jgi:hypothetical protein